MISTFVYCILALLMCSAFIGLVLLGISIFIKIFAEDEDE